MIGANKVKTLVSVHETSLVTGSPSPIQCPNPKLPEASLLVQCRMSHVEVPSADTYIEVISKFERQQMAAVSEAVKENGTWQLPPKIPSQAFVCPTGQNKPGEYIPGLFQDTAAGLSGKHVDAYCIPSLSMHVCE